MTHHESEVPGLKERWSALRADLLFLPRLAQMTVETAEGSLEAVEFVKVEPVVEEVMLPAAPQVPLTDVWALSGWSEAESDQLRLWSLVGQTFEGSKVTRTCPDCGGTRIVTCHDCHGHGQVSCSWCGGAGRRTCSSCGGSGHHDRTRTETRPDGSSQTVTEHETCMHCGGMGHETCISCMGSGRVTCSQCRGSGEVTCETCCPAGTVDHFTRVTFRDLTVKGHVLPFSLPEYPQPIQLTEGFVQIHPRDAGTPYDAVESRPLLTDRGIAEPDARLFFVRTATATLHKVYDPGSRELAATYIDGEPAPMLVLHRTSLDPDWTPERERRKALAAAILYAVGPLLLVGLIGLHRGLIGIGVMAAAWLGAARLKNNPFEAFRLAFLDYPCKEHYQPAPMRCPACGKNLCHECLLPSGRCPGCGQVMSKAVTHLVVDGHWVEAEGRGNG